jgi:hypothetical protein
MRTGMSRRGFGVLLAASTGIVLSACVGGDGDSDEQLDCNNDGNVDLLDDCNKDGILDDKDKQCCPATLRKFDLLYDVYQALRSGMTKAEVIRITPVAPFQGADTEQVLWVKDEEALGVRFNGTAESSVIVFAQWGLSVAAGGRTESRSF